jgi:hypothetical protein
MFKRIPYPLALKLVRMYSTKELLNKRLEEYSKTILNAAISKAKTFNRSDILEKRNGKKNERVVLALTFNPKLSSVTKIIKKY